MHAEAPQHAATDRLLQELATLSDRDLRSTLVRLNARRRSLEALEGVTGQLSLVATDILMGDAFAHLGQVERAFASWERSLSAGMPALTVNVGSLSAVHLVNRRRIEWRRRGHDSGKPRVLLIGEFGPAFMLDAEVVQLVARADIDGVAVAEDGTHIGFQPETATMDDIMEKLPKGWLPDVVLATNFEMAPLPRGIERVTAPLVGWVGDLINYFEVVSDCLPMFDLLITDQERDADFARQLGLPNVGHVLMQALQSPRHYTLEPRPYSERTVDIAFLGLLDRFPIYERRREVVRRALALSDRYNVVALDNIETVDRMYEVLGDSRIGLNVNAEFVGRWATHPYRYACPRRVYEVMAAGAVCLTPHTTAGLAGQYEVGREVVCFDDDSFEEQIDRLLGRPEEGAAIASAGRERTLAEHSAANRVGAVLSMALGAEARGDRPVRPAAVLRQHYAMEGPARPSRLPMSEVHELAPNDRVCVEGVPDTASGARFAQVVADRPDSVTARLNEFSGHVEAVDWDAARRAGDALLGILQAPTPPSAFQGWMRRELYLGELPRAAWWRADLRIELGNAVYADPARGDGYADYMRRHLQVSVRDAVGCVAHAQGDGDYAVERWEQAHALDPRDEYVALRLAAYWEFEQDDDRAMLWSRRAEGVRPFNAGNSIRMALIHERRGQVDVATNIYASLAYQRISSRAEAVSWRAVNAIELPSRTPA